MIEVRGFNSKTWANFVCCVLIKDKLIKWEVFTTYTFSLVATNYINLQLIIMKAWQIECIDTIESNSKLITLPFAHWRLSIKIFSTFQLLPGLRLWKLSLGIEIWKQAYRWWRLFKSDYCKWCSVLSMKMNCECRGKNRVSRGDCCKKTLPHPEFGEFLCSCLHGEVKNAAEDGDSLADRVVRFLKYLLIFLVCF